jgi:hypothetical protein
MSSAVEEYLLYQINNAPVRKYPYPHIYVENVFPTDFYAQLRANWPDSSSLVSLAETDRVSKGAYPERFVLPFVAAEIANLQADRRAFWTEFGSWFMAERFLKAMLKSSTFRRKVALAKCCRTASFMRTPFWFATGPIIRSAPYRLAPPPAVHALLLPG